METIASIAEETALVVRMSSYMADQVIEEANETTTADLAKAVNNLCQGCQSAAIMLALAIVVADLMEDADEPVRKAYPVAIGMLVQRVMERQKEFAEVEDGQD